MNVLLMYLSLARQNGGSKANQRVPMANYNSGLIFLEMKADNELAISLPV